MAMEHAIHVLEEAWFALRLSVRCPVRAPFWDAVIVTAASPQQAELFQQNLEQAKRQGTLPDSTLVMAVPDPCGRRVGSGAATLCALRALSEKLELEGGTWRGRSMAELRVLLLHAGGDSKRVPWANAVGKAFLVLPFLCRDVPDGPIRTLFDHIIAISVHAVQAFQDKGGLFIMTGDVLPCFAATALTFPENGVCVVTVPASLDLAANHGVIVSQMIPGEDLGFLGSVTKVDNLLQKPSEAELVSKGAVGPSGNVFVDTGMFGLRGNAWSSLIDLALLEPDPVAQLLSSNQELSLYEEVAGAWVPARHEWLRSRPLGNQLISALGANQLYHYCAHDLTFLHFGTSTEILDHLAKDYVGRMGHQQLCFLPRQDAPCHVSTSAVIVASEISAEASVGNESLVYNCSIGGGVVVGNRCVMMGMHIKDHKAQYLWQILSCVDQFEKPLLVETSALNGETESSDHFSQGVQGLQHGIITIPDGCCLWEVPLKGPGGDRITLCCGAQDNPKAGWGSHESGFCGTPWKTFLARRGMQEDDLWPKSSSKDLWNAKVFPIAAPGHGLLYALWLMGAMGGPAQLSHLVVRAWRKATRLSFADLHDQIDFQILYRETLSHQARLATSLARASIIDGSVVHDFSKLCQTIVDPAIGDGVQSGVAVCKDLLDACLLLGKRSRGKPGKVPASRLYQVQADVARACRDNEFASVLESHAREAICAETAEAVWGDHEDAADNLPCMYPGIGSCMTTLPVRFDITGGWSDTPPWSLEQKGRVLNMAVLLNGAAPVGAKVSVKRLSGLSLLDDAGNREVIEDIQSIKLPLQADDPFRLVKAALIVTGYTGKLHKPLTEKPGLEVETWANVPRGSGLGTSSILAAAVVRSLLKLKGRDDCKEIIARLVLVLEQLMGTGGGWQDQIGGLYPGVKCTCGFPGPGLLQLSVQSIALSASIHVALQQRMVVVFTGQVRLASTVLERVVHRYLQRDATLIHAIKRLTELAGLGEECILSGDLDQLGRIMLETWKINQELDPFCSNTLVDSLFKKVEHLTCGYKLVGAGGGGFGIIMAKNALSAEIVKANLLDFGPPVQVYDWSMAEKDE